MLSDRVLSIAVYRYEQQYGGVWRVAMILNVCLYLVEKRKSQLFFFFIFIIIIFCSLFLIYTIFFMFVYFFLFWNYHSDRKRKAHFPTSKSLKLETLT